MLRFVRLRHGRKDTYVHGSADFGTHWLLTYAVPSLEDPRRAFLYAGIVAEKEAGDIFYFPSRTLAPFVEPGSYIEADAEGRLFRWRFEGGRCHTDAGRVVHEGVQEK